MPLYVFGYNPVSTSHPTKIHPGPQTFQVSSYPGSKVCLYKDNEVYSVGTVNGIGQFEAQIEPLTPGTMYVTVTNKHYMPYEGQVTVDGPPAPPTGLTAYRGVNCVILEWNPNGESDLASYNVYRKGPGTGGEFAFRANVPYNFFNDYNIEYGTSYQYVVTAVDDYGYESDYSNIAYITPMPPTPPAAPWGLVTIANSNGTITLDWDYDTSPDFAYYAVYRSTSPGGGYGRIASGPMPDRKFTDRIAFSGTTYYYVIVAVNKAGLESDYSNEASATSGLIGSGEGFVDGFEVSEWNGMWTEDSQNDWFRSTQRHIDGSYSAEVDGYANNAALTSKVINLGSNTSAVVWFSWYIEGGLDTEEYLAFDVSTNGGITWTERDRFRGNVDPENS
jgi:hypothetical protein